VKNRRAERIGLALGSGAARGWAHIGVIRALEEAGLRPQVVCGTSMGAVVGAAHAAGELDAFERWGRQLDWREMFALFDLTLRGGLIKARRLFEFFESVLPDRTIESLELPFAAVGTDLATGQELWLREGSLLQALRASIALPGLITPARWEGRWLVDGGLVNPVPVSLCRALGADRVIAVDLNTTLLGRRLQEGELGEVEVAAAPREPAGDTPAAGLGGNLNALLRDLASDLRERFGNDGSEPRDDSPNLYEVIANSINIMQVRIGRSRMAGDPPELLVSPRMNDFGLLDFDRADEAITEGRRAVQRALESGLLEI
jgi:NTE family protein